MILCLGTTPAIQRTLSFSRIEIDGVNRAIAVRQFASGKSINAARVLKTLDVPCTATGILGGDSGKFIRQDLDRAKIRHDFVDTAAPTRMCMTLLDLSAGTATELIEEALEPEVDAYDDLLTRLSELIGSATVLLLSGSLAPGAGDDFYAACVRIAKSAHVDTILDATGQPLLRALSERPTVVKPNRSELAATLGTEITNDSQIRDAIKQLVQLGAGWVTVTDGPRDVFAGDEESLWRITTPKITPVNAIGSGDSFAAGLAAGIAKAREVPEACKVAIACAAANALTADAGHVEMDRVNELISQIELTRVEI